MVVMDSTSASGIKLLYLKDELTCAINEFERRSDDELQRAVRAKDHSAVEQLFLLSLCMVTRLICRVATYALGQGRLRTPAWTSSIACWMPLRTGSSDLYSGTRVAEPFGDGISQRPLGDCQEVGGGTS